MEIKKISVHVEPESNGIDALKLPTHLSKFVINASYSYAEMMMSCHETKQNGVRKSFEQT